MNEQQTALLEDARLYVSILFEKNVSPDFRFHNLSHVQNVADACSEIGSAYQLNDEDRLTLQLSAWFHDTGYRSGSALNHEDSSIEIARDFLLRKNADSQLINNVTACIQATKMPQSPQNLLGQILCDADLAHLGSEKATAYSKLLRQEINLTKGHHFGKKEWALINVAFMKNHQYFTDYAKEKFEPIKQEQIKIAEEKYGLAHIEPEKPAPHRHEEKEEHNQPEKKPKPIVPSRGIETMFRTTSANHFTLSSMADSKANIMISVNSIIISITVSVLFDKLTLYPYLIIPTAMLICVCLSTIIFAILATRPNVSGGVFTKEDIEEKKTNLLFFGNFHKMRLEEYQWGMKEMMKDSDYLYGSMIKDIYFLGVVLARKYRYLRISYTIFMFGLIVAISAFAVALAFQ